MELSVFDIIDNGVSNQEISISITEKLKDKYNEEFCIKMIGNRYGTVTNDFVCAYCFPKNNEKVLFNAKLNKEQTILEDDYYLKKLSCKLQENFEDNFKKIDADIIAKIKIIGLNKLEEDINLEKFVENFRDVNFLTKIVCTKNISKEALKDVYSNIEKNYKNINLKSVVYSIDDSDFNKLKTLSEKLPELTDSIIQKYNVKEEKLIKISDGNIVIIN